VQEKEVEERKSKVEWKGRPGKAGADRRKNAGYDEFDLLPDSQHQQSETNNGLEFGNSY